MLRNGGHAVDAVVAAGAVLAVVEPSASGLGGDAFFLVDHRADGEVVAVNGSGAAPEGAHGRAVRGVTSVPLRSASSCTTPDVLAWWDSWSWWGSCLGRGARTGGPACAEGYPISWRMGAASTRGWSPCCSPIPGSGRRTRGTAARSAQGNVSASGPGRNWKRSRLQGGRAFYEGRIAEALCRGTREAGGTLGVRDLAEHESVFTNPYRSEFGDRVLLEQPLPSQGIVLSIMSSLVGGHPLERAIEQPAEELHRQAEAKKVAFALKQAFLTDPKHLPVPEEQLIGALLSPDVIARLGKLVDQEPTPLDLVPAVTMAALRETKMGRELIEAYEASGYDPANPPRSGDGATDTTYLCAADRDGNQVGLIQSVFHPYGSGFQEPSTGVLLNNRACGFSLSPGHINFLEPGKRSLHTLNSYMVRPKDGATALGHGGLAVGAPGHGGLAGGVPGHDAPGHGGFADGLSRLVGGTPGGDNQVQTNLQILRHLLAGTDLWTGPTPQMKGNWTQARRARSERARPPIFDLLAVALEAPRWRLDPSGQLRIESRIPSQVRKKLTTWGHDVVRIGPWEGSGLAQLILTLPEARANAQPSVHVGATDPRGEGVALGV
ncbi:MAG: gamma-glutamyltransferase [Candidatus Eisenbacteria bacterium]